MDALVGQECNFILCPEVNVKLVKKLQHWSDMVVLSHPDQGSGCIVLDVLECLNPPISGPEEKSTAIVQP